MTMIRIERVAMVLGALALAGCGGHSTRVASTPPPPPMATVQSQTDAAFDMLMRGDEGGARKQLKAVLKRAPMDPSAHLLSDSIDRDPKDLLGPQSYPYTAHDGDTVVALAQRYLGNRLKAYQLLRYNGLKAPAALAAGQVLRIPGEAPQPEVVRRAEPSRPASTTLTPAARPRPAPPKPSAPVANPVAARQARAAGLAALNQGNVGRAVALLRRAAELDPGNAMIGRDRARAERIAATVKARK